MLRDALREWTDIDEAAGALASALGMFDASTPRKRTKHVFWASNPLGDALQDILDVLLRIGALERSPDESQYRWNAGFAWEALSALPGRSSRGDSAP
jgi:hypothetical protein